MNLGCIWSCHRTNNASSERTGLRATFYYPGGGTYKGFWLNSQHHDYGVKVRKDNLLYNGQWFEGKRHGWGSMDRIMPDGLVKRVYVGQWRDNHRCGEGKGFYKDGNYVGYWKHNKRHGFGIMWYKDGTVYLGEWQADVYHGLGVLFYINGNRYEGHFARGYKNGEGNFFHNHTGQIQKGVWENDIAKASVFQDEFRHQVDRPTPYPIPKCRLARPNTFIHDLFAIYLPNAYKPMLSLKEENMLIFISRLREYCKLEPRRRPNSSYPCSEELLPPPPKEIPFWDMLFPCTCKKRKESLNLT